MKQELLNELNLGRGSLSESASWQQEDSRRVYGKHILPLPIPMVEQFSWE